MCVCVCDGQMCASVRNYVCERECMNKHMCLRSMDQHVHVWVRDGRAVMVKVMFVCVL